MAAPQTKFSSGAVRKTLSGPEKAATSCGVRFAPGHVELRREERRGVGAERDVAGVAEGEVAHPHDDVERLRVHHVDEDHDGHVENIGLGERRQLQQPGRDGGGRREAGQHEQQRAGLRAALGRECVQRQVPGALHRGVDVRTLLLDIRQRRGQLDAVQRLPVVGDERGHRVHRPRDGPFSGASELTLRADESEAGQDAQRDGQSQERDREVPGEAPHEPILGPRPA